MTWDLVLLIAFIPGSAWWALHAFVAPFGIGTHASIYTEAARAWLAGGDPWRVGPPEAVFAGPPTMLLPFAAFTPLGWDLTRLSWVVIDGFVAVWALRRLALPAYWLIFPPLFGAIVLGHPEVVVLGLVVLRHPIAGLAVLIKPYAAFPFFAERRFRPIVIAAVVGLLTFPFLPWQLFWNDLPLIVLTIIRQDVGDSVFGQPIPMAIAAVALASLGFRRALWLFVPVMWPFAQPIYKTMTIPILVPVVAVAWAMPVAGATLAGVVAFAVLVQADRWLQLPNWLRSGIQPISRTMVGLDVWGALGEGIRL